VQAKTPKKKPAVLFGPFLNGNFLEDLNTRAICERLFPGFDLRGETEWAVGFTKG
jgi:hypothetical protein